MRKDLGSSIGLFCLTVFALAFGIMSAGCGGGGAGGSSSVKPSSTGKLSFTVKWPVHSRLIPENAMSIVVTIMQGATPIDTATLNYTPPATAPQTLTSHPVPATVAGTAYSVMAQAFPLNDGVGVALASGTLPSVKIVAGVTSPITLTMGSTLTQVAVQLTQPGQTDQNATVQAKAPQAQSGALTIIPTLKSTISVSPDAGSNVLYLFPNPTGSIGSSATSTVQLSSGLLSHLTNLQPNNLLFNTSAAAIGSTGFTVNYYEPQTGSIDGALTNLIATIPVAVTVGPVTASSAPTAQDLSATLISSILDVTYDSTASLKYLVLAGGNTYIVTGPLSAPISGPGFLAQPPAAPNLLASLGSNTGFYGKIGSTPLRFWDQSVGFTLTTAVQDLNSTSGDTGETYVLDTGGNVLTVTSSGPGALTASPLSGTPKWISVGTDLNSSAPGNRVIYWIDNGKTLHQTFTTTTAGEPVFGSSPPTNVSAVAEAANCPLTFIIVGTTLEAISQTGTVVATFALPSTNLGNTITYTHLAVSVLPSGVITGAAVGLDSAITPNPIDVTF